MPLAFNPSCYLAAQALDGFKRFSRFYSSSRRFGADFVLREYLQCPPDFPIPLSISHGVDAGQGDQPYDVNSIEPIHWCTNRIVFEKSKSYKASVLIPHPWVLVYLLLGIDESALPLEQRHRLIVLPPPGPINDKLVVEWMSRHGQDNDILLVKARGDHLSSLDFFRKQGFSAECISGLDKTFYFCLYRLLLRCKSVVGLTASSLLFFSASMGINTSVCRNFCYHACDVMGWQNMQNYSFPLLREFILGCLNEDFTTTRQISASVLGEKYFIPNIEHRRLGLIPSWNSVEIPYYSGDRSSRLPTKMLEHLAFVTGKSGFLSRGVRSSVSRALSSCVGHGNCIRFSINEIDCILNGKTESNFAYSSVKGGIPGHGY